MRGRGANWRGAEVGRLAYEINVQQYACAGLNFGTYYDRSPIIAYDGAEHPAYTMSSYTPIDRPWLSHPASVARRRQFALRRHGAGVHAAAVLPPWMWRRCKRRRVTAACR